MADVTEDVPHPPLHPNCRCRITPWLGQRNSGTDVDLPAALASEDPGVRVAAAKKLLEAGVDAARRAVKRGTFR